jgi:OOP family OmpA-OmpF porin
MKNGRVAAMTALSFALLWLSISSGRDGVSGNASVEFKRINFPEKRPDKNEPHVDIDSVLDGEQKAVLQDLAKALTDNPVIGARVVGFSDKNECRATECNELSLRRARLVFDWLLRNGVPAKQLKGPDGESTDYPLDDGDTEEERALNRRVQLEPYTVSSEKPKS